jgi:hypothetical protein
MTELNTKSNFAEAGKRYFRAFLPVTIFMKP